MKEGLIEPRDSAQVGHPHHNPATLAIAQIDAAPRAFERAPVAVKEGIRGIVRDSRSISTSI